MTKPVLKLDEISKAYRLGIADQRPDTLFGHITGVMAGPFRNFCNLRRLDTFNAVQSDDETEKSDREDCLLGFKKTSHFAWQKARSLASLDEMGLANRHCSRS